jgi:hypothetical protein
VFIRTVCGVYDSGARFRVEELQPMDCHATGSRLHERDTTDIVNLTKAGNSRESRRKGGGRRRVRPHGGSVQVRQGVWHMGVMHARLAHAPYRVSLHDARRGVPCGAKCHVERHGSRRIVIVDRHVTHRRDTLQHFTAIC